MSERAVVEIWQIKDLGPISLVVAEADLDLLKRIVAEALDASWAVRREIGTATRAIVAYLFEAAEPEILVGTHRQGCTTIIIDFISSTVTCGTETRTFRKWVLNHD